MRVLFVFEHVNFFRNLDGVARELQLRGHQVTVLHGTPAEALVPEQPKALGAKPVGRGLQVAQSEIPGINVGFRPQPNEPWQNVLCVGRQVLNCSVYARPQHPSPDRVIEFLERRFTPRLQRLIRHPLVRGVLRREWVQKLWRSVEDASAPSPTVVAELRKYQPDVVIVSPTIWPKDPIEADYLRAAQALGIPTVGYISSWDNLTSKGTIHVVPDVLMVWNEPIAQEAVELHAVPRQAIRIVGAPHLDAFFSLAPTETRREVCRRMGASPDLPYFLFLCSSRTLVADETPIVSGLLEALSRRLGDGRLTFVVRPHPTNARMWNDHPDPRVIVWPRGGDMADCPEAWQAYFNEMSGASAIFGLNTTAFLEAAVADRPCLTIVADQFYASQGRTGHFRHLVAGGFLEIARDYDEIAERVERILGGADVQSEGRKRFVRWFLRPNGVGVPASTVAAELIESLGPSLPPVRAGIPVLRAARRMTDPVPGLAFDPASASAHAPVQG